MDTGSATLALARAQFAFTTIFHMIWPILTVGLGVFLVILEIQWLASGDTAFYHHARFWSRLFLLNFAIGVATGLVMEFQFGTNWGRFSAMTGGFFGDLLGFEGTIAFMLEAGFLGIMMFGWNRVGRGAHLLATILVAAGASLSAFWILVANSWMQTPSGGMLEGGRFVVTRYSRAILNEDMPWATTHMWVACVEATAFVVGGLSAWYVRRGRNVEFFLKTLKLALVAAVLSAPLQIWLGDRQGRAMQDIQPEKLAAMEAHWDTNPPGTGAAWAVVAWPDRQAERNPFELSIPYGLSLIETRSLTGRVQGLKDFPPENRPPIVIPFYAFRIMVAAGLFMLFVAVWTVIAWARGRLQDRRLLAFWIASIPLGYVAVETGWITREVGRQPWIVYGLLRTEDAFSPHPPWLVLASLIALVLIYAVLLGAFAFFAIRFVRRGPDLSLPLPGADRAPLKGE